MKNSPLREAVKTFSFTMFWLMGMDLVVFFSRKLPSVSIFLLNRFAHFGGVRKQTANKQIDVL